MNLSKLLNITFLTQDVAERVAREASCRHFEPLVLPLDAYSLSRLPTEELIVFVASTTGQVSELSAATATETLPAYNMS